MKIGEGFGASFVVPDETSEPRCPGEGSFDNPSSGQQDKAEPGLRQHGDLKPNTVSDGRLFRFLTRIALIGGRLDRLGPVSDISRRDVHGKHMAERAERQMQLRALLALRAVITGPGPAFRRRAQGAAVGCSG